MIGFSAGNELMGDRCSIECLSVGLPDGNASGSISLIGLPLNGLTVTTSRNEPKTWEISVALKMSELDESKSGVLGAKRTFTDGIDEGIEVELDLAVGKLVFGEILDGVEIGSVGVVEGNVVSNISYSVGVDEIM